MLARRARLYDALALLTVIIVISLDQWTKTLVVTYLSPPYGPVFHLVGDYLTLYYIQNRGAAFGLFANNIMLALLIAAAVCVIVYLYARMLNSGPLIYKLIFGLIIGGAAGNLTDRVVRGGYVVDFIFFRIPEVGFSFAVFNLADASISIGVVLLLAAILFNSLRKANASNRSDSATKDGDAEITPPASGPLRSSEQDAKL